MFMIALSACVLRSPIDFNGNYYHVNVYRIAVELLVVPSGCWLMSKGGIRTMVPILKTQKPMALTLLLISPCLTFSHLSVSDCLVVCPSHGPKTITKAH